MTNDKFQIFPAIDIIGGRCVRLVNGDYSIKSEYSISPVEQSKKFKDLGYQNLHIIDLDGARDRSTVNMQVIKEVLTITDLYTQVGGGIRTAYDVKEYHDIGVDQVIMSSAIFDKEFEWDKVDINKVTASLDFKNNKICINGWFDLVENTTDSTIQKLENLGIRRIIVTDISKDGALSGPNIELAKDVKNIFNGRVLLAGGVRGKDDVQKVKMNGLDGVIVGKALYEKVC